MTSTLANELEAAILYIDVRRSSEITLATGRAGTVSVLSTFITTVADAVVRHDGWVATTHGDAVLSLFTGIDRVARAVGAALAAQAELELDLGMAVDVGPVRPATVPAGGHLAELWVGQATNTAAHLANLEKGPHSYVMLTAEAFRELPVPGERWSRERQVVAGGVTRRVRVRHLG